MNTNSRLHSRRPRFFAFTLVEMMVATALSGLVVTGVVYMGMFTSKSFSIIGNYVDLDAQSRNAADVLSRQIRDASALLAYSSSTAGNPYLLFTNVNGSMSNPDNPASILIKYYPNNSTLTLSLNGGSPQTLLNNCNSWSFSLYDRAMTVTTTNITFGASTNGTGQVDPTYCKLVNMTWNSSRTILGSKFNTESVQTAEIVLRNQVSH